MGWQVRRVGVGRVGGWSGYIPSDMTESIHQLMLDIIHRCVVLSSNQIYAFIVLFNDKAGLHAI